MIDRTRVAEQAAFLDIQTQHRAQVMHQFAEITSSLAKAFVAMMHSVKCAVSATTWLLEVVHPYDKTKWLVQATAAVVAAAREVQETLRNMHLVFAADSEEVQREWLKFTRRVRALALPAQLPRQGGPFSGAKDVQQLAERPVVRASVLGQVDDRVATALRHAVKRSLAELAAALHGTRRMEVSGLLRVPYRNV